MPLDRGSATLLNLDHTAPRGQKEGTAQMFTVIHRDTYEIAYEGPHSNVASRHMTKRGAYPAGWVKVKGNRADARGVLARLAEREDDMCRDWSR